MPRSEEVTVIPEARGRLHMLWEKQWIESWDLWIKEAVTHCAVSGDFEACLYHI